MNISQLKSVDSQHWQSVLADSDSPFTDYDFLLALETSQCLGESTGWIPRYHATGNPAQPESVLIAYEKWNSYGEYIFDWDWANAYEQLGLDYYPKILIGIPFTPATVPKLLGTPTNLGSLFLEDVRGNQRFSGVHALFLTAAEEKTWQDAGLISRHSLQFHWHNQSYESFDEFLKRLTSKRRRQIERERRQFDDLGLTTRLITGSDLTPEYADWMYQFYCSTLSRKWGQPYLNRPFFETVFSSMGDRIAFFVTERGSTPIGGALCFFKGSKLYGRYWGCTEEVRNMHFELCYYRPIDFAIAKGLAIFEAGAQGLHKVQRGFVPTIIKSAHELRHPQFHDAIRRYITTEKVEIERSYQQLEEKSPYAS